MVHPIDLKILVWFASSVRLASVDSVVRKKSNISLQSIITLHNNLVPTNVGLVHYSFFEMHTNGNDANFGIRVFTTCKQKTL